MRLISFIFLIFIFGCKSNNNKSQPHTTQVLSAGAGAYISSYTKQSINIDEELHFRFSSTVTGTGEIGRVVSPGIFSIQPKIAGKAYWKDAATLVFEPTEMMEYDKNYNVQIQVQKLFPEAMDEFKTIALTYHTKPLDLSIRLDNIQYGTRTNDRLLNVSGRIKSNNVIDNEKVEELLKATQKGNNNLKISWNHYNKKNRRFTIENIERKKTESELIVSWDGKKYNSDQKGTHKLSILPIGFFNVINAVIDETDKKTIVVSFSDQLDRTQDLTGLITIPDYKGKLKIDKSGSKLRIHGDKKFPSPFSLFISENIKRTDGDKLKKGRTLELSVEPLKPTLALIGKGVIVPENDEIIFPFTASNLNTATVEIYKIFQDNVLQYLQYGSLERSGNMHTVGRVIHRQKINLYDYSDNETAEERRIALNIKDYIQTDPGAIYQVRVGFDQRDMSEYDCESSQEEAYTLDLEEGESILDYRGYYSWDQRENPCHIAYYSIDKYIHRNILASDLGIIAKYGTDKVNTVSVTDLKSIDPLSSVQLQFYDLQKQLLGTTSTDGNGMAQLVTERQPSFIIALHNGTYGYLNLQDRYANSLSEFEVSGKTKSRGLDGMIYGERGVWRPGDTLFLNFMLEDKLKTLPADHPIKFEVTDSRSNKKYSKTTSLHLGHIYHFPVPTNSADPTGNWRAVATVGKQIFTKTLKVETVKPNRLKIDFEIPDDRLELHKEQELNLSSTWLHGAMADGLKTKVDLQLSGRPTSFKNYKDYIFDDPARKIESLPINVHEGTLNENGKTTFKIKALSSWQPAGKLNANLKTRVYEKSGNFSEDNISVPADLYKAYIGIDIPKTRWGDNYLSNDGTSKIRFQSVNADGKPIGNRNLTLGLYKARWSWWYDRGNRNKYQYNSATHNGAIIKDVLTTNDQGAAEYAIDLDEEYGNYMIRICDEESGHCTGGLFYTGRNWSQQNERKGPQLLKFTTDKKEYKTGEKIKVNIPSNKDSKIFISIENGNSVLSAFW